MKIPNIDFWSPHMQEHLHTDTHHIHVHTIHCVYTENATNFHLLNFPKLYLVFSFTINNIIYR